MTGPTSKSQANRAQARRLYVEEGLTVPVIARQLDLSDSSVRKYRSSDAAEGINWDHLRLARLAGAAGSEEAFRACVLGIAESINATLHSLKADPNLEPVAKAKLLAGLADSLRKTISSAKAYSPEVAIEVVVAEVLEIVASELAKRNPAAAQTLVECLDAIKAEIIKRQKAWQG